MIRTNTYGKGNGVSGVVEYGVVGSGHALDGELGLGGVG